MLEASGVSGVDLSPLKGINFGDGAMFVYYEGLRESGQAEARALVGVSGRESVGLGGEGSAPARSPGKAEGNARLLWTTWAGGGEPCELERRSETTPAFTRTTGGGTGQPRGVVPALGSLALRRPRQALSELRGDSRSGRGPPAPATPRWIVGWGLRRPGGGGGLLHALRGPSRAGPVA